MHRTVTRRADGATVSTVGPLAGHGAIVDRARSSLDGEGQDTARGGGESGPGVVTT